MTGPFAPIPLSLIRRTQMRSFYEDSRRVVAALLIAGLGIQGTLALIRGPEISRWVTTMGGGVPVLLLCLVVGSPRPRLLVDALAFLTCALSIGVSWGASAQGSAYLTYVPPIIVATCFATAALILRAEGQLARDHSQPRL